MATTSQTYSLIPTSTFASGFSTPTDDPNGSSGGSADLISSSGSPTLIVGFLAIGLFVLAVTGVFGWRRVSQSHGIVHQPIITNRRPESISLGKRPILCDVWADPSVREKSSVEATRWENITPVTAILTFLTPPVRSPVEPCPPTGSADPGGRGPLRMLRCLVSAVKRFYSLDPTPPPPPAEPDEMEVVLPASHTSDEIRWGDASSLQVSVIIAMPTQGRRRSRTSGKEAYPERMGLGEFCIGVTDMPWMPVGDRDGLRKTEHRLVSS